MDEQERAELERIATAHVCTFEEVALYQTITGDLVLTEVACKARDLGCAEAAVKDALIHSEATTAEGIRRWIANVRRRGNL